MTDYGYGDVETRAGGARGGGAVSGEWEDGGQGPPQVVSHLGQERGREGKKGQPGR